MLCMLTSRHQHQPHKQGQVAALDAHALATPPPATGWLAGWLAGTGWVHTSQGGPCLVVQLAQNG